MENGRERKLVVRSHIDAEEYEPIGEPFAGDGCGVPGIGYGVGASNIRRTIDMDEGIEAAKVAARLALVALRALRDRLDPGETARIQGLLDELHTITRDPQFYDGDFGTDPED